ncbi:MAG: hypothetical protein ACE5GC_04695 [Acidimicrobiia bacterium]
MARNLIKRMGLAVAAFMLSVLLGAAVATARTVASEPLTQAQQQLIDWAQSRFETAGLAFPAVDVFFHPDSVACRGRVGLYYMSSRSLHMCRLDKNTMLHELAHAWDYDNLTDADRVAFMAHRGLTAWNDHDEAWEHRGAEHLAEVMVWALIDHDVTVTWTTPNADGTSRAIRRLLTIPDSRPDQLAAAYRFVTGSVSPVTDASRLSPDGPVEDFSPEARFRP